jgi:probable HAF family extracellular repeat protein
MSMSSKMRACLATTVLLAMAIPAALANRYTIEDLGNVDPSDIDKRGDIVGQRNDKAVEFQGGSWHVLKFANQPGDAVAINARGDAVGFQVSGADTSPIRWERSGRRQVVPLPAGGSGGSATAISSDGTVVGTYRAPSDPDHSHCFRTQPDGTSIDLGLLAQGDTCIPAAIDGAGNIVGDADFLPAGGIHAFLWSAGTFRDLGTLGGDISSAKGINEKGQVVGWTDLIIDGASHAFRWRDGVMEDLGISTQFPDTRANSINDKGDIVGRGLLANNFSPRAVRFDAGTVVSLGDEVDNLDDWVLSEAVAVNNDGVIVGTGIRQGDGKGHGFLLRPLP